MSSMAIQNNGLEIRKRPFANGNAVELSDTAGNPVRPNERAACQKLKLTHYQAAKRKNSLKVQPSGRPEPLTNQVLTSNV